MWIGLSSFLVRQRLLASENDLNDFVKMFYNVGAGRVLQSHSSLFIECLLFEKYQKMYYKQQK